MRTNLNIIFAVLWVSFSVPISNAQTWYDSEGRELIIDGKKVIRKEVKKSVEEKKPEKEVVSSIIPKALELRPELSTAPSRRVYEVFHPYSNYGYSNYGHYGQYSHYGYYGNYNRTNLHYSPYHNGCYRGGGIPRSNFYLNYQRGGLSIQTRF